MKGNGESSAQNICNYVLNHCHQTFTKFPAQKSSNMISLILSAESNIMAKIQEPYFPLHRRPGKHRRILPFLWHKFNFILFFVCNRLTPELLLSRIWGRHHFIFYLADLCYIQLSFKRQTLKL